MKKNYHRKVACIAMLMISGLTISANAQNVNKDFPLIPYPASLQAGTGSFNINANTQLVSNDARFSKEAAQLNLLVKQYLGTSLKLSKSARSNRVLIKYDGTLSAPEGYQLTVSTSGITLSAKEAAGIFRGIETIRQLMPADERSKSKLTSIAIPAVTIADQPAYAWRGMHLDVSRHFFSIAYLEKFIDLMALYKFNKFHLHLTDDQGWRIEIKKYPKLTEEGAWRTFNNQDTICMNLAKTNPDFAIDPKHIIQKDGKTLYGGFYTQEEMKGLVAYAMARHIDIIPEIDMPGHMMAAINNYPFLSSDGESSKWGKLFTTPICPCKETTYEFAQNVFTEIMSIFPSKYIHIGGDEVDRTSWETAESCKELMEKNNIKTTAELQSYFINRMEKFFNAKGRQLIGWDEILEDGISSTAVVMYWRSWVPNAPIKAAKNGNKVVMSPGNPLYFDNYPDRNSLYEVYHFNPIPAKLTAQEAKGIIGAQANTWSEKIPTENRADYMIFPRMTALAEVLWSNKDRYESYLRRLKLDFPRLDALDVSYRLPGVDGLVEQNVFIDEVNLAPVKPLPTLAFHYTTDGTMPTTASTSLDGPLKITSNSSVKLAAFTPQGRRGDVYDLKYTKQDYAQAVNTFTSSPGLTANYYPGEFKNSQSVTGTAKKSYTVNEVAVPNEADASAFVIKFQGFLEVPTDGIYSFFLNCDDGGVLRIADRLVVDNDGPHGPFEKSGQVALRKGLQPIALDFIEGGGGYTLKLKYSLNGNAPKEVPSSWLKH